MAILRPLAAADFLVAAALGVAAALAGVLFAAARPLRAGAGRSRGEDSAEDNAGENIVV